MDWFEKVKAALGSVVKSTADTVATAGDDELGREDLLREACDGVLKLKRHGAKGKEVFPPGVIVRVAARDGSLESLRRFVVDPGFEQDLDAMLKNRLTEPGVLPARRYVIALGERNHVAVEDDTLGVQAQFVVEGGDKDGDVYLVALSQREWRLGRGRWHQESGDDQRIANDVVLSETLPWVWKGEASAFDAFLRFTDWMGVELGRTHSIALLTLAEYLYRYLSGVRGIEGMEEVLSSDWFRGGVKREKLAFFEPAPGARTVADTGGGAAVAKRQRRHLARDGG